MATPLNPALKGGHVRRYESMLTSPAYRDLSTVARCLLEEFQRLYRQHRNGKLSISTRNAVVLLKVCEPTASKAYYELEEHGFLVLENYHKWMERKAREYRITFLPSDTKPATDEWSMWKGEPLHSSRPVKPRPKKQGQSAKESGAELLHI